MSATVAAASLLFRGERVSSLMLTWLKVIVQNPYTPPQTRPETTVCPPAVNESIPIIPALIGLFTYGASYPYALALCVEHYLRPNPGPMPWSIHVAAVLSSFGSVVWFTLVVACAPHVFDLFAGEAASFYTQLALMTWLATIVFFVWMIWRAVRFRASRG